MKLKDNLHQLASTYEYALDWLNTEVLSFQGKALEEVNLTRTYLENKIKIRDENVENRGEDRALKSDIEKYYNLVSLEATDPLAFIVVLSGGRIGVPYIEQIGGLVDKVADHRFVELGDMHIKTYIELVTARRDITARILEVKEQSERWYEQVLLNEREVLEGLVNRRLEGLKGREELSPYNLYDMVYQAGQVGRHSWVGDYRGGSLYTFWLHQLGMQSKPRLATLEEKHELYKEVYNIKGGNNVKTTKKEVDLSKRFVKMLEKEIVEGNIRKEDVQVIKGEQNIEAYGVGLYTLEFLGEVSLYKIDESEGKEVKLGEWAFTKVLVRDLKKIMSKIKEG